MEVNEGKGREHSAAKKLIIYVVSRLLSGNTNGLKFTYKEYCGKFNKSLIFFSFNYISHILYKALSKDIPI